MHIRVIGVQELAAELVCLSTLSEKCKLHSEKYHWQSTISRPTIVKRQRSAKKNSWFDLFLHFTRPHQKEQVYF